VAVHAAAVAKLLEEVVCRIPASASTALQVALLTSLGRLRLETWCLKEDNIPPLVWKTGIIEEVFPGQDGHVRVALVRTSRGHFKRPVVKLIPLPRH
jgi:hypothetical protein